MTTARALAEANGRSLTLRRMGDFDDTQNERIRAAVRAWLREKGVSQRALAVELKISDASVSNILSGKNGMGYATARAFATLAETTVDALAGAPGPKGKPDLEVVREDRYHALAFVREQAKADGTEQYLATFDPPFKATYQPSPREMLIAWDRHIAKHRGKAARGDSPPDID